jgi:hypothetical protein
MDQGDLHHFVRVPLGARKRRHLTIRERIGIRMLLVGRLPVLISAISATFFAAGLGLDECMLAAR